MLRPTSNVPHALSTLMWITANTAVLFSEFPSSHNRILQRTRQALVSRRWPTNFCPPFQYTVASLKLVPRVVCFNILQHRLRNLQGSTKDLPRGAQLMGNRKKISGRKCTSFRRWRLIDSYRSWKKQLLPQRTKLMFFEINYILPLYDSNTIVVVILLY